MTLSLLAPVSPYAAGTVALARGIFISLCVGLFIVSQALSQMCTATAPAAWVHTVGCTSSSPIHTHMDAHVLQRAVPGPHESMGTLSCKVRGEGEGGHSDPEGETERDGTLSGQLRRSTRGHW